MRRTIIYHILLFLLSPSASLLSPPRHLFVLIHGLAGTSDDLSYLAFVLEDEGRRRKPPLEVQVLRVESNMGQTLDGVMAGAQRCAREVQAAVQGAEGRLSHISFVGNSLGGIYARAAAALLYNDEGGEGTVAGLRPDTFCTISTPHLGVRDFTYLPISQIPGGVRQGLTTALVGQTGRELMLDDRDDETPVPLVYRMATEERFLAPLRSFRRRRAYGNLAGDFMVPFSTALFNVSRQEPPSPQSSSAPAARWGILDDRINPLPVPSSRALTEPSNPVSWIVHTLASSLSLAPASLSSVDVTAEDMARGLDSLGWSKVGCRIFQPAMRGRLPTLPLAHNAICSLGRRDGVNRILSGVWQKGRPVMDHCGAYLLEAAESPF
jgi:hypothetical protein